MSLRPVSHTHTDLNTLTLTQLLIPLIKHPPYPFLFVQSVVWVLATLDLLCGEMIQRVSIHLCNIKSWHNTGALFKIGPQDQVIKQGSI